MAQLGKSVKGKSKEKKKPKVKGGGQSSAEKALEDRVRRMKENDYLKRVAQAAKRRLQQGLETEAANSKVNMMRIQNQWRKIMRLAKVESLRKDIEIESQNHERDVDRKDAIIQMLDRDLEEAEEQYQMALRSHLMNVDKLIDLQDSRLLALENEFEGDLRTLANEFQAERDEIVKQHQSERTELMDIMAAVEAEEHEREAEAKQEHEQLREETRNKNLEDINVLRITLESTIEDLERHFESAHLNYLQHTDQRTQDFKFLTRKDQELSREIEVKIRKIEKLQQALGHWRTKIQQNAKECEERNSALKEEKDQISGHFQMLKSRMNRFRDAQARRLSELTKNARGAKGALTDKLELAERILKLAELARKLETEQEKVLPFYESSQRTASADGGSAETGASTADDGKAPTESVLDALKAGGIGADGQLVQEWNYLDNFFKKFNKVLLDKVAIEREKERLKKENKDLQTILKQYLDGITVNEDVMRSDNPLLVVNGRVNLNRPVVRHVGRPTIVEGNNTAAAAALKR